MKHYTCTLQFVKTYHKFRFPIFIEKMILKRLQILLLDATLTAVYSCALLICKMEHVFLGRGVWEIVHWKHCDQRDCQIHYNVTIGNAVARMLQLVPVLSWKCSCGIGQRPCMRLSQGSRTCCDQMYNRRKLQWNSYIKIKWLSLRKW
jgi:hypothetical protein